MYSLMRLMPLKQVLLEQAPILGTSLVIAEMFYKFHSFTWECLAFLGTWYLLDAASNILKNYWRRPAADGIGEPF